jgi:hypothetical protein
MPVRKVFRFNQRWYWLASTGDIFEYFSGTQLIACHLEISNDEYVGLAVCK